MSVGSVRTRRRAADAAQSASSFALSVSVLGCAMFVVVTTEFVVVGLLPAIASDLSLSLSQAGWLVSWFALGAALLLSLIHI